MTDAPFTGGSRAVSRCRIAAPPPILFRCPVCSEPAHLGGSLFRYKSTLGNSQRCRHADSTIAEAENLFCTVKVHSNHFTTSIRLNFGKLTKCCCRRGQCGQEAETGGSEHEAAGEGRGVRAEAGGGASAEAPGGRWWVAPSPLASEAAEARRRRCSCRVQQ